MMFNKWIVVFLPFITTSVFAADVYVCEKNGRKEFSQLPCGDNAVILKTEGEPSSLKLTIPFKAKQITALCELVIKAKDRAVQSRKTVSAPSYSGYNYNSQAYRYRQLQQQQARYDNQKSSSPEAYVLGKIENLESIAKNSPPTYQILKNLTNSVYYQGYEESPIYQAERAAALTSCEENLSERMRYLRN